MPVLHFAIGKENMNIDDLVNNFMTCYKTILNVLPAGIQNIKSMYMKTTMGKINYIYKK
jgi:ribosomal protein L1